VFLRQEQELIALKQFIHNNYPDVFVNEIIDDNKVTVYLGGSVGYTDKHTQLIDSQNSSASAALAEAKTKAIITVLRIEGIDVDYFLNGMPMSTAAAVFSEELEKRNAAAAKPELDKKPGGKQTPAAPIKEEVETKLVTQTDLGGNANAPQNEDEVIQQVPENKQALLDSILKKKNLSVETVNKAASIEEVFSLLKSFAITSKTSAELGAELGISRVRKETVINHYWGKPVMQFLLGKLTEDELIAQMADVKPAGKVSGGPAAKIVQPVAPTPEANAPKEVIVPPAPQQEEEEEEEQQQLVMTIEKILDIPPTPLDEERMGSDLIDDIETISTVRGFTDADYQDIASDLFRKTYPDLDLLIATAPEEWTKMFKSFLRENWSKA
jgi:hypothetical protein